ncbi:MAG: glycosyltransferase family 39 protein [Ignavibacteriales bacterium]|nr:MAG: glycosyltransferase family 39 protein [Ignavibacteriales bacterium]
MTNSSGKIKNVLFLIIILWSALQIIFAIPDSVVEDWAGWRQADTQTIARNFFNSGENIFYPQINWGGNGPGYLECEFQLYTYSASLLMYVTGETELPGQLLNILVIALTAITIFLLVKYKLKNESAALAGSVVFLTSNLGMHLSTAVMPDAMCILFYVIGFYFFVKFLDDKSNSSMLLFVLFSILSALIKPMALNLGIIQFFIVLFGYRQLLKSPKLWLSWLSIVAVTTVYLLFSNSLYQQYGNTFGVLSGDSKFPTLKGLMQPVQYAKIIYLSVVWGLGVLGTLGFIYLVIKRRVSVIEWALIIGNLAAIFIPMRYTVDRGASHYYVFTAFFGAWLVGKAYMVLNEKEGRVKKILPSFAAVMILVFYLGHMYLRINPQSFHYEPEVVKIGNKLKEIVKPGDLIIARSVADEREQSEWGNRINNFEDPRIFYLANVKGWSLPNDSKGFERIKKYIELGADYFAEPFNRYDDETLYDWLDKNAELIFESDYGRIFRLSNF